MARWYWTDFRKINEAADGMDMGRVSRKIGYRWSAREDAKRCEHFKRSMKVLTGTRPAASAVTCSHPDTPLGDLPLLAVDIETTGLDPARDHVLAIGWVPVDGESIDLGGARKVVLQADAEVGQSATIHGLTDDDLAEGVGAVEDSRPGSLRLWAARDEGGHPAPGGPLRGLEVRGAPSLVPHREDAIGFPRPTRLIWNSSKEGTGPGDGPHKHPRSSTCR